MLFPLDLLSATVFLGHGQNEPDSTGFFVSVKENWREPNSVYLVTAKHCVEDQVGLYALVNKWDGGVEEIDLPDWEHDHQGEWYCHPDAAGSASYMYNAPSDTVPSNVDIAVTPIDRESAEVLAWASYTWLRSTMFFDEMELMLDGVNPYVGYNLGDELTAVGLYHVHMGKEKTLPLVRTGHLAMVPREPVRVDDGDSVTREWLYLAELRSIGGMSGSPVYAMHRTNPKEWGPKISLLGVLLGGWREGGGRDDTMASGIAMVAPARILGEVLAQEALVNRREEEKSKQGPKARRDHRAETTDPQTTRSSFMRDLKKVTKREAPRGPEA